MGADVYTPAASVEPHLSLASRESEETVALQIPHVSLTACLYAHCGRCHLSFPPSNNIFLLSAVPRRLRVSEIRGGHDYRWENWGIVYWKLIESWQRQQDSPLCCPPRRRRPLYITLQFSSETAETCFCFGLFLILQDDSFCDVGFGTLQTASLSHMI